MGHTYGEPNEIELIAPHAFFYRSSLTLAFRCADLTVCKAGTYASTTHTATADRKCSPCPAGTFTDTDAVASSSQSCKAVQACAPGSYRLQAGTRTSDAVRER